MKRNVTPNKEAIKKLREKAQLTQKELRGKGLNLSYRQYQRAEGGEKISFADLERIAEFFDGYLKNKFGNKDNVYVDDITLDKINTELNKDNYKNFSNKIYLHKINNYEQISNIIKQSKFQNTFYPNKTDKEQIDIIKKIVKEFKNIYFEFKNTKKTKNINDYENIEKDLDSLDVASNFSFLIEELNDKKIYLYANNYNHHHLGWYYHDESGLLVSDVLSKNYAIFSFNDYKTSSLTFQYETKYPKQRLLKLINDKPWSSDDYTDDMSEVEKNFEDHYKEYVESNCHNFDKSKITLVKTNIEELVDQEELDNYVNKAIDEIVEDGELMWRPDISDYIDPKDD